MSGFTEVVRQELSRLPLGDGQALVAELAALARLAGTLHLTGSAAGSRLSLEVSSRSGAVVRRFYSLSVRVLGLRPQLWVREPSGVRTATTFGAGLAASVDGLGRTLGLFDDSRHPVRGLPAVALPWPAEVARAALLANASVSSPGRPVHLEITTPTVAIAEDVQRLLASAGIPLSLDTGRSRLVAKDGQRVGELLVLAGADQAVAKWDEARQRRDMRNQATRLTNADAANLRRVVTAAREQQDIIDRAVARIGWGGLSEDVRAVALARLVNPTASLQELGEMCEPPVGKSSVHRRIRKLAAIADGEEG